MLRRRSLADVNRHQFTTIDDGITQFGAGRHARPGQNFANALIKMILVTLIFRYDFKMIDGDTTPTQIPSPGAIIAFNAAKRMHIRHRLTSA